MSLPRILFVDDEPAILEGLENQFRRHRRRWEMLFAVGGRAALDEMRKAPVDVVVTDIRMPGMDGAELLGRIKDEHPGAARIVLSGQADEEAVIRSIPVAQQFLSKPCDAETLRVVVERTLKLRSLVADEAVRAVVGKLEALPPLPAVHLELSQAAARPDVEIADLAAIIEKDPAMSVKVLQLVNSAYFGLAQRTASLRKAVAYLGVELLRSLALSAHVFQRMEALAATAPSLDRLQRHSLGVARLAKRFARDPAEAEEAFTAALVHDVGELIVASAAPGAFLEIDREARASGRPLHVVEHELLGTTHAEAGAYLLCLWGLPTSIVEAVAYHHAPSPVVEGPRGVLAAVHVANELADSTPERAAGGRAETLDMEFLTASGYADRLPEWRAMARVAAALDAKPA